MDRSLMFRLKTGKFLAGFLLAGLFLVGGCSSPEKKTAKALESAREALDAGNVNQAIEQLVEINEAFPGNPEVLEQLGFAYAEEPDPFSAAIFLQQAVDADPTRTYLLNAVAENFNAVGDRQSAKAAYAQYLGDFPEDGDAWYALAQLYRQDNQTRPAVDAYLRAFQLLDKPLTGEEAITMGDLFFQLGNIPRAEDYYQTALEADDLSALPALFGLLRINAQAGNWGVVQRIVDRLDTDFPGALDASEYANLRLDLVAWRDARRKFEEQRERQERAAAEAADNLANNVSATSPADDVDGPGDTPAAETTEVAETTPDSGGTADAEPEPDTAVAANEPSEDGAVTVLPAESDDAGSGGKLAAVEGENVVGGMFDPLEDREEVFIEGPALPEPVNRARQARLAGDYATAVRVLWEALSERPSMAVAWHELSLAYLEGGDPAAAETASLEAMRLDPFNAGYVLHHVDVIRESRSPAYVMRELRRAKERFPNHPEITYELARGYEEISRDPRNAVFLYRQFLEIAPNHPLTEDVRNNLRRLGAL